VADQGLRSQIVGDHSIAYRAAGDGPPLVFLHGFLCDSRCWRTQLEDLSDQFTVIAWDAPGAGASSDPPDVFTTADWSRCLGDFLTGLGVERAHVIGLSWGGIVAQDFFRMYPSRVAGLVLADTYAGWSGSLGSEMTKKRIERCFNDSHLSPDEFAPRWVPEMFTASVSQTVKDELAVIFHDFHPHGFRLMTMSTAETDSTDLLPKIDVPTLLIWGEDDERSPLFVARQFKASIPGAELAVIKNAGHVSNMERPDEFNALVRRFCVSS
jgi:pimeloyl-ACP methyl ester carboxylesterase